MRPILFLFSTIALFVFLSGLSSTEATGNSAEAQMRKDTCEGLVQKNHNKGSSSNSDSDSGDGDSNSDESADSGSDSNGDGDSDSSSGDSSDSGTDKDSNSDGSNGNSDEAGVSESYTVSPKPSGATSKPKHRRYHCDLVDALRNISITLTVEQQMIMEEFIRYIEITILADVSLTDVEKVVRCSYAVKHFFEINVDIKQKCSFEKIAGWGFVIDFIYVSVDLQADVCEETVTLDASGSCPLFEALLNATQGDSEKNAAVIELIAELKIILSDSSLSYAQKMTKLHASFKLFLEIHVEWKEFFLSIEIEGFGSLEMVLDVSKGYKRALTLDLVISGSSDADCALCKALSDAVANTSYTLSVRSQLKQYHDKIVAYFATVTDVQLRMAYCSEQYWQMILMEPFIIEIFNMISIEVDGEEWGTCYDLLWVSQFCKNSGSCGCLSCGLGGTTAAPSTTLAPTTTVKPISCGTRASLIAITAQNTTVLTDVLTQHYNSWSASMRLSFSSTFNLIKKAIWDHVTFPTASVKITEIVKYFKQYSSNALEKQKIVMDIFIGQWDGKVQDFCDCGSG